MNEQQDTSAETEANQDASSPTCENGKPSASEDLVSMNGLSKILFTVCGVLLAALIFISTLVGSFLKAVPLMVSENHDEIIELRVTQDAHSAGIDQNTVTQQAASIERKAMERAILMLSGDVKHLTSSVEMQNRKLDKIGEFWMEYKTGSTNPGQ